jgi:REP element-mobilizing transposase RayT
MQGDNSVEIIEAEVCPDHIHSMNTDEMMDMAEEWFMDI